MDPVRREAQNDVAVRNLASVNHLTAVDRTNRTACEIEPPSLYMPGISAVSPPISAQPA